MDRKLTKLINDFKTKTDNFISEINNNFGLSVSLEHIDRENVGQASYRLSTTILGLKERLSSTKKGAIDALVVGYVSFNTGRELNFNGYNSKISYCRCKSLENNEYQVLSGFHFDYRKGPTNAIDHAHPLFHAQQDRNAAIELMSKRNWNPIGNNVDELRGIRIPTAQMDFFSILHMLIADHLVDTNMEESVKKFENYTKEMLKIIPQVDISCHGACQRSLNSNLPATAWYFSNL